MDCLKPIFIKPKARYVKNSRGPVVAYINDGMQVPCGKCAFCLVNKRSQWMFRIHHEMRTQMHRGYFITLTYDEKHVPRAYDGRLSLRFRDVQLYLKKIRKQNYYAKYICVGEYGGQTLRPHYHLLIWTDCPDKNLEKIWAKGRIHFGTLTMASAMYTLKYIIQPKHGDIESGLEKTRAQFSKGLGLGYLNDAACHYHVGDYESPNVFSVIDGRMVGLPRYYKDKIFTKYQKAILRDKLWVEKFKEGRKEYHELRAQGIARPKSYLMKLRLTQAERIIEKTKYNLTV